MKKILLFSFFVAAILFGRQNVIAQIVLEQNYPGAKHHLYMVNLDIEGMKYIWRDILANRVVLYNLDHSIFKIMLFPSPLGPAWNQPNVLYVTEHLFNSNDSIEYMFVAMETNMSPYWWHTIILNEAGTIIFSAENEAPNVMLNIPQAQQPIYNTPNGAKMILTCFTATCDYANVYSIPGTLTTSIEPGLSSDDLAQLKAYPNPNNGNATIEFKLPQGINSGEIVLYKMDGSEVKRYRVDGTFGNLILNNSGLSSGTYMYQLVAGGKAVDAKRMIVVH